MWEIVKGVIQVWRPRLPVAEILGALGLVIITSLTLFAGVCLVLAVLYLWVYQESQSVGVALISSAGFAFVTGIGLCFLMRRVATPKEEPATFVLDNSLLQQFAQAFIEGWNNGHKKEPKEEDL